MERAVESSVESDARVVEDVLAFIDAFHATSSDDGASDGSAEEAQLARASDELRGSLMGLRVALRDLCDKMLIAHGSIDVSCDDFMRGQLSCVMGDETTLEEIQHGLRVCQLVWEQLHHRPVNVRFTPLQDPTVASVLRRRLDELIAYAESGTCDRPLLQQKRLVDNVSDCEISPLDRGVMMRFRSGRFIPFKLSVLTRAAWSVVADSSFAAHEQSQAVDSENKQEIVGRLCFDDDGSESVTALRRVDIQDGSVVICWASIHTTRYTEDDPSCRLFRHSEAHEMGWVRVGRLTHDAWSQPRAFIETVCDVVLRPANDGLDDDQEIDRDRFERFRSFMRDEHDRDGAANRQELENRMLEMTLASSRRF